MTLAIAWPHDPGEDQNRSPAPGPMTLAIPWPHPPGENAAAWPHEPGDRQQGTRCLPEKSAPVARRQRWGILTVRSSASEVFSRTSKPRTE